MTQTDEAVHVSADELTAFYVGEKSSKYKSKPLGDMMPAHLYRATSTFAQPALAMTRWVIDMFLHNTLTYPTGEYSIVPHSWLRDAPAHIKFEAALELARVQPEYRPYALISFMAMAASSKAKGAPEITAKSNPYAMLMANSALDPMLSADMTCAMRTDYPTSPYNTLGRGAHPPAADDTVVAQRRIRVSGYDPEPDCGAGILDAVRAGLRLWRGCGARKLGTVHEGIVQHSVRALDPAAPLTDSIIQIATAEGLTNTQIDDTHLYLDIAQALGTLTADERYASYMHTLQTPPVTADNQVSYDATYHAQVGRALSMVPRWSWITNTADNAALTDWERDKDPKTLLTAASAMMRTMQAIGLFGGTVDPSAFVDGVAIAKSQLSKVDPLTVQHTGVPAHDYAVARADIAKVLGTATTASGGKLMPGHETILKALETPESSAEWIAAQADPEHRAELGDVIEEIEYRARVLREVMLQTAEAAVDENIGQYLKHVLATYDPANVLAALDQQIAAANKPNLERYAPAPATQ